ncbi:hypothetical protein M3J09_013736 [Ascochyta lentis]
MRILGLGDTESNRNPGWELWSDSIEICGMPAGLRGAVITRKKMDLAISDCLFGDLAATRVYLATSNESKLFLHGRDRDGDSILIKQARERHHSVVSFLVDHGANVNAVNGQGRSALMEAALWGRLENVKALLTANAKKSLKDIEGRSALDFAQPTPANEKERYRQCELASSEKVRERDQCRRHIAILLDSPSQVSQNYTAPLSDNKRAEYSFQKSEVDRTITLCGPITKLNVQRISKTAAILDRGGQFPRIAATSGWAMEVLPLNIAYRPSWITHVFTLASTAGHELPATRYDHGEPGKYYASHSEKKLIAYFIEKQVFTPQDRSYDEDLQQSLYDVAQLLEETKTTSAACKKVCALEDAKEQLEGSFLDAEDELTDAADGSEESNRRHRFEKMIAQTRQMDEDRRDLETEADVLEMRHQQKRQRLLLEQERLEQGLIDMSWHPPALSLSQAVIWSSNEVCKDCEAFKDAVNSYFALGIDLTWI